VTRAASAAPLALLALAALLAGCRAAGPTPGGGAGGDAPPEGAACDACDRPADGRAWPDGRRSCARCRELAVVGPAGLAGARAEALAGLRERFALDLVPERLTVTLVDRDDLVRLAGATLAHPHLRAFTEVEDSYRGERLVHRQFRIYVLRGLPGPALVGVLAHELFHVHQVLSGGGLRAEEVFREGAAQYVQHEVLQAIGAHEWADRLRRGDDPVYGAGLRRFQALVTARGEEAALRLGATGRRFPSGY